MAKKSKRAPAKRAGKKAAKKKVVKKGVKRPIKGFEMKAKKGPKNPVGPWDGL